VWAGWVAGGVAGGGDVVFGRGGVEQAGGGAGVLGPGGLFAAGGGGGYGGGGPVSVWRGRRAGLVRAGAGRAGAR